MIDCNICKHKEEEHYCIECKHGELFERKNVSEPQKISVSNGREYCGHCGYVCEYARGYKKFYCMEERILLACENGNPLDIKGKAYFIKSDIQNLRDIMDDIEVEYNAEMEKNE